MWPLRTVHYGTQRSEAALRRLYSALSLAIRLRDKQRVRDLRTQIQRIPL